MFDDLSSLVEHLALLVTATAGLVVAIKTRHEARVQVEKVNGHLGETKEAVKEIKSRLDNGGVP